jgi:hypothetical protein
MGMVTSQAPFLSQNKDKKKVHLQINLFASTEEKEILLVTNDSRNANKGTSE